MWGEELQWDDKEFIRDQQEMQKLYEEGTTMNREKDGFVIYKPDANTNLVIVPSKYAKELTMWQHRRMCHAGHAKVAAELGRIFHWPAMKKNIRQWLENCHECQLLKAKRKHAHQHFRAKPEHEPRRSYGMDYYGVEESENGFKQILGIIDLATSEVRLFPTKNRKGGTTANCMLHGLFLRNGVPAKVHSDHAKEFISKAVKRICDILGCRQTTTLAHHPTGNSTIERLWQYVSLTLRQMRDEQYKRWDEYVRLMEHTWNTTVHTLMGVSPFEAAHGIPAVSVAESLARGTPIRTVVMKSDAIQAMQSTAKACISALKQLRQHDKQARADKANNTRQRQTFKVGDKVAFFIPPTAAEAKRRKRKAKHIMPYKGPAVVTNVRTPTTYDIEYKGKRYARATAELRPYRAKGEPADAVRPEGPQEEELHAGEWVAYRDDMEDTHFHVGKIVSLGDFITVEAWATTAARVDNAQWKPLYQITRTGQYTTQTHARRQQSRIVENIPAEDKEEYIMMRKLTMLRNNKLTASTRRKLAEAKLKHHRLGHTFP